MEAASPKHSAFQYMEKAACPMPVFGHKKSAIPFRGIFIRKQRKPESFVIIRIPAFLIY